MVGYDSIPKWVYVLLNEGFFEPCLVHLNAKKNEKNVFCLDCCLSLCPQCLASHRKHRLLQIRRYVYHDVLRLKDAEKLMDCSLVQAYYTNSAKVVFMKERPLSRPFRSSGNVCITCHRCLQDPFLFCSLSCKVQHMLSTQGSIQSLLCTNPPHPFFDLDDYRFTPDSVLDSPGSSGSLPTSSGSTSSATAHLIFTSTTEIVRKKRTLTNRPKYPPPVEPVKDAGLNRRKGVPNRSPFY